MTHDLEFVFRPETQAIFDHFCALLGIRIAFFTPTGEELRAAHRAPICKYCRLLRRDRTVDRACRELDAESRNKSAQSDALTVYTCHGGMREALMPVRFCGRLLGFVMIGQFRQRTAPPAAILSHLGTRERQQLKRAYLQAPYFAVGRQRHAIGLFETLVRHISENRLIDRDDAIGSILNLLKESPENRLPLRQAAALTGRSPSAFSRIFHKIVGQSYEQTRIQLLLEKADELLQLKPKLRVQEIAFRLGYDDPLYFSRLYKKHRGISPRAARKT